MRQFIYTSYLCFKSTYGFLKPEEYVLERLINSVFQLCFFVMLATFTSSNSNQGIVVIGNALIVCSQSCIGDLGMTFTRERYFGTLKILLASGKSMLRLFLEKSFFMMLDSIICFSLVLLIAYFLFPSSGFILRMDGIVAIMVSIASCMAVGCVIASLAIVISDINFIYNIVIMSMVFLSGANIMISKLPWIFQMLSSIMPLRHGLEAISMVQNKYDIAAFLTLIGKELAVGIVYMLMAYILFRYFEKRAIVKANIDVF